MDLWHSVIQFLNSVPGDVWSNIGDILFAAVVVSPAALAIKKWLNIDDPKRREKIMTVIVILGSMGASALLYLHSVPEFAPWFVLVQGWLVYATTQPVYYLFVKPLATRIGGWFTQRIAAMATVTEAKGAAVPPEGLPVTAVPPPVDDFSR